MHGPILCNLATLVYVSDEKQNLENDNRALMAILMEFLNLIVPIEKINQSNCPGGFEGHLDSIGRNNLGGPMYYDKHLFRMGFMDGWMIGGHIAQLESYGLVGEKEVNGELKWIDFCVIANGFDSNPRCDWLEFGESEFLDRGRRITWLKGQEQGYHYPDRLFRSFDLPEREDTPLEIQQTSFKEYWNDPIEVHRGRSIGFNVKPSTSIKNIHSIKKVQYKAAEALRFCKLENLNTEICVLIDMSVHSGEFRLHIYNFNYNLIIKSSLCSHGCGNKPWSGDMTKTSPVFSNTPDSHLSSLGKYRIGKRGYSNWGIHVNYRLHGLESTNSNAFSRDIVLHSWESVADLETYPKGTPEGWGCPAVSDNTMRTLDSLLQNSGENVLLWIYN